MIKFIKYANFLWLFSNIKLPWFLSQLFYTPCVLLYKSDLFKKQQRLQGKEVRFLTKKRQVFARWLFTIFFVEQYPNRPFHQLSFHVPLLVSKRAVVRHKIKRMLIRTSETFLAQKGQAPYYKAFVTLHKMKLAPLLSLLEAKKWEEVETMLSQQRTQVFSSFLHHDAKSSSQKKSHISKSSSSSQ